MANREGVIENIASEKLLPPVGIYSACINGSNVELEIGENRVVKIGNWDKSCKTRSGVAENNAVKVLIEITDIKSI